MRLAELGKAVRIRRLDLGITQDRLARMAGLSRTTVNQLEKGTLADLGYSKVADLLSILGLDLQAQPARGLGQALAISAQTASTSYRDTLTPEILAQMLESGEVPSQYRPHLVTLLDETPLALVVGAINEVAKNSTKATPRQIMRHMSRWANELHVDREAWR